MIITNVIYLFFFFSSRRRHTRSLRDWSSDVCSSDLERIAGRTQKPSSCVVEAVRHLLRRRTLKIALLGAGLAAGFAASAGADIPALPTVTLPTVTLPTVTLPTVTLPPPPAPAPAPPPPPPP